MESQKASLYKQRGEMPVLGERPIPTPKDNQVLVKVLSAGVNSLDVKRIEHDKITCTQSYPMVLGSDVAGEVHSVGSNVRDFKPGDRVFFQGSPQDRDEGGFQQYAVQDADIVGRTPSFITDDQAATLPHSIFAALMGLFHHTGLRLHPPPELKIGARPKPPNTDAILIIGGATPVGQFAVQFAKMVGFTEVLATASSGQTAFAQRVGATHIYDRHAPDAAKKMREVAGEGLRYGFDPISTHDTMRLGLQALAIRHPVYFVTVQPPPPVEEREGFPKKPDGSEWKEIYASTSRWREFAGPFYRAVEIWLETNQLKLPKPCVAKGGLAAVGEALQRLKQPEGEEGPEKWVIRPWET